MPAFRNTAVVMAAFLVFLTVGCASQSQTRIAVEHILSEQRDAWNRGDIDGFMQHYLYSDDLTFSAGGSTERGWQATYDRYKNRYPTSERMGRLTFSELEVRPIGECGAAALVLGRWQLDRQPDAVGGNFSLVMEKVHGKWVIVHDHTSVAPSAANP